MTALGLAKSLSECLEIHGDKEKWDVGVIARRPGSMGATPRVRVMRADAGFDHNRGTVLLTLEHPVTLLSPEDVEAIHTSAREAQSWHTYQIVTKLRARITELEGLLAAEIEGKAGAI
jgi:hypothetical protein